MFAALPLILSLAPEIARWLGGSQAAGVTAAVSDAVRTVTGTDDPEEAAKTVAADPTKAAELRVQLAKIAADAEAAQRESELDALKATLAAQAAQQHADLDSFKASIADTQSARQQELDLAKSGSWLAWGAPILSGIILISFATITYLVLIVGVNDKSLALGNVLVGSLTAMATQVANYWLGSSLGSSRKDLALREARNQLASSVPGNIASALAAQAAPGASDADDHADVLNTASLLRAQAAR